MRLVFVAVAFAAAPLAGSAGEPELPIRKGMGGYTSTPCGFISNGAEVTDGRDGLLIGGQAIPAPYDAEPCLQYYVVREAKRPKGSGAIQVEMRWGHKNGSNPILLQFSTASPLEAFNRIFVDETDKEKIDREYKRRARIALEQRVLAAFFSVQPLASISEGSKRRLAQMSVVDHERFRYKFTSEDFKNLTYFVADLGRDDSVYNEEKLTQAQRLAHLLNAKLLALLRELEELTRGVDAFGGIKLEMAIPHKSFVTEGDTTEFDRLEIYAPIVTLRQFVAADLTARKFLDGSIILINENRTEVPPEL